MGSREALHHEFHLEFLKHRAAPRALLQMPPGLPSLGSMVFDEKVSGTSTGFDTGMSVGESDRDRIRGHDRSQSWSGGTGRRFRAISTARSTGPVRHCSKGSDSPPTTVYRSATLPPSNAEGNPPADYSARGAVAIRARDVFDHRVVPRTSSARHTQRQDEQRSVPFTVTGQRLPCLEPRRYWPRAPPHMKPPIEIVGEPVVSVILTMNCHMGRRNLPVIRFAQSRGPYESWTACATIALQPRVQYFDSTG